SRAPRATSSRTRSAPIWWRSCAASPGCDRSRRGPCSRAERGRDGRPGPASRGGACVRIARIPHRWALSPRDAAALQRRLAARVEVAPLRRLPRRVAGLDAAFLGETCIAGAVLWDLRERRVVEARLASRPLRFPYVPGLLSFREAPALLAALRRLRGEPEA